MSDLVSAKWSWNRAVQDARPLREGLSVVIATLSRPDELATALRSVAVQTRIPDEIVIVDQSTDDTSREAATSVLKALRYPSAQVAYVLDPSIPGLTHARNVGARVARFDLLVYIDDDVSLEPECLARLEVRLRIDQRLAGVGAVITNYNPRASRRVFWTLFRRGPFRDIRQEIYWSVEERTRDESIDVDRLSGSCVAYRTCVVRAHGFDEHYRGYSLGEDAEFSLRLYEAGLRLAIDTSARVCHTPSSRGRERWGTRMTSEVCAAYYLLRRHFYHRRTAWLYFVWLLTGLLFEGITRAATQRRADPLTGFFRGLLLVARGLRGCSFIQLSEGES